MCRNFAMVWRHFCSVGMCRGCKRCATMRRVGPPGRLFVLSAWHGGGPRDGGRKFWNWNLKNNKIGTPQEVFFADLVDLRAQLHGLLPPIPRLSSDELRWLISRPPDQDNEPMLTLFVGTGSEEGADQQEWRALAQRFPQMNVIWKYDFYGWQNAN